MNHQNSNILTAGVESRTLGSNVDNTKSAFLVPSKLSNVSELTKNSIIKRNRTALGDIGNCESTSTLSTQHNKAKGDNPTISSLICKKEQEQQQQKPVGTMKPSAHGISQLFGLGGGGDRNKDVDKRYRTLGASNGKGLSAAIRGQQLQKKESKNTGRSFRVPVTSTLTSSTQFTSTSTTTTSSAAGVSSKPSTLSRFGGAAAIKKEWDPVKSYRLPQPKSRAQIPSAFLKPEPDVVNNNIKEELESESDTQPLIPKNEFVTETEVEEVSTAFSEVRLETPVDIDAKDASNPILVSEYINDIMDYMFALEKKYVIPPRFLDGRQINSRMRAVLLDWLIEVHDQYGFTAETLYMCNKILDRYLKVSRNVTRQDLQLVGVTSLYLAAKYEEVYTPTMKDFAVICDNAFEVSQICRMESDMLKTLSFDLSPPQPCFFLRRFSKAAYAGVKLHALAKYIMELSVVDYSVADLFPSEVAAAALGLALMISEKQPLAAVWTSTLEHYSRQKLADLRPLVLKMANVLGRAHEEPTKLQAVKKKYSRSKAYLRISKSEDLILDNWRERVMADLQESS